MNMLDRSLKAAKSVGAATILTTAIAGAASAVTVVDQSQATINTGLSASSSILTYGQSFTAGMSDTLDSINVFFNSGTGAVTMSLYQGTGVAVSFLSSVTETVSGAGYYGFGFSASSVALTAGQTYTFALSGSGSCAGCSLGVSSADSYANGRVYYLFNGTGFFEDSPLFDMAFETVMGSDLPGAAEIPLPASLPVFGLGLAALGLMRSRKA